MKTTFCSLAHSIGEIDVTGWLVSEKLDGMRCIWDGGVTRGRAASAVPWANPNESRVSTGLWTRLGHVISAPDWWIDKLPAMALDGELYSKTLRQEIMSIVKRHVPDERWSKIILAVFDSPGTAFYTSRAVSETHFKRYIKVDTSYCAPTFFNLPYSEVYKNLVQMLYQHPIARVLEQRPIDDMRTLDQMLGLTVNAGGEGLMARNPRSYYECCRTRHLLKIKRADDAEGTVIGWESGEGKLAGMMGALIVEMSNGVRVKMSGFTDWERGITGDWPSEFPKGTIVTFKYNGLSKDSVPQFPRYWRKRVD